MKDFRNELLNFLYKHSGEFVDIKHITDKYCGEDNTFDDGDETKSRCRGNINLVLRELAQMNWINLVPNGGMSRAHNMNHDIGKRQFINDEPVKARLTTYGEIEYNKIKRDFIEVPKANSSNQMQTNPKVFVSYAWESDDFKDWVRDLAIELRNNGIDAKLDQWEVIPGDQMPHFMEKSVRENDYVLIICTPKYKIKSENRIGGVGYEGDIMTAEVLQNSNHRKFIPILQSGDKDTAIPSWLKGKYFIDLSNDAHFEKNFEDLITTVLNSRETAPKLGQIPSRFQKQVTSVAETHSSSEDDKVKIKGIIVDEVTEPRNDGSKGSALYKIPFELNKRPSHEWIEFFIQSFNHPPQFTQMHRPGIATVYGNKIYLDGTTIEEVERYHKRTLKLAVDVANNQYTELQAREKAHEEQERIRKEQHKKNIDDISKRMSFDD